MGDVSMEWKEVRLGDISFLKNGKKRPLTTGAIPVYGGNGVMEYVDINNNSNAIIIGRVGAYCGCVHRSFGDCWVSDNAISINARDNADINFLYYCLKNMNIHHHRIGGAQPLMTQDIISNLKVSVPNEKNDQRRIASILSSLDRKIEQNNKINAQLEEMAQAIFKSWFVDFTPFKNGKFVESELGMIPEGWRVGTLGEIAPFISRGISPKYNDETEEWIIGQTCVRNNIVTLTNARKHLPKSKSEKWLQQWDIMINSTGIGSLGRVGIVYFDMTNVAFDSHLTVVRVANPALRHYVGRNLLTRQLEIENMAVGSTGQTELPRDRVKVMKIVIPEEKCLKKFNALIEPSAIKMYKNIQENNRLAQLRDTLLPKLMSGEIEV